MIVTRFIWPVSSAETFALTESDDGSTGEPPKLWSSLSIGLHDVNPKANILAAMALNNIFFISSIFQFFIS